MVKQQGGISGQKIIMEKEASDNDGKMMMEAWWWGKQWKTD